MGAAAGLQHVIGMISMLWATAILARFTPRRAARRLNYADKEQLFFHVTGQAAWHSERRSHLLPFRVRPGFRLPTLSWFPGHNAAHEAKFVALGNCLLSSPISATRLNLGTQA